MESCWRRRLPPGVRRDAEASGSSPRSMPARVYRILGNEFGERFSYYGLRAVLALYFVSIGNSEAEAVALFSYTSALAYFMPILGGVVADVFWGRYRTIYVFSLIYICGSLCLALSAALGGGNVGASAALVLISVGTGGIKPCVSAFGADQLDDQDEASRARYFSNFYLAINVGSTLSFVVTPFLRVTFGFPAAFAASAFILMVATVLFVGGRSSYKVCAPTGSLYVALGAELWQRAQQTFGARAYQQLGRSRTPDILGWRHGPGDADCESELAVLEDVGPTDASEKQQSTRTQLEARTAAREALTALQRLMPVLLLMPCFWALFDQQGSAWVLQAQAMRLDGILPFGWKLSPETLQILNPIFVIVLLPLTTRLFEAWPRLFNGKQAPPPLYKIATGMVVATVAFVCSAAVQGFMDASPAASVSALWQVPQLFLMTLAEVLVSVVSLDYVYAEAPDGAKTAVSALALLTVSVGDIFCGLLYQVLAPRVRTVEMLLVFSALMLVNAIAFFIVARGHKTGR